VVLVPLDDTSVLRVDSRVDGSVAYVDGRRIGIVPAEVALEPGPHRVRVERPEHRAAETTVVVEAAERTTIRVNPTPRKRTVFARWWFWAGVGVLAAGGTSIGVAAATDKPHRPGDLPPGTISVPLGR
jgi:hypothetical protein